MRDSFARLFPFSPVLRFVRPLSFLKTLVAYSLRYSVFGEFTYVSITYAIMR